MKSGNRGGVIIHLSSVMANRAGGTSPAYIAAKGALLSLTYEMAALYGPSGIRVLAVCPGNVTTAMSSDFKDSKGSNISQLLVEEMEDMTPLQRSASPEEIAEGVFWLSSNKASFINGTSLDIDGGFAHNFNSYKSKRNNFQTSFERYQQIHRTIKSSKWNGALSLGEGNTPLIKSRKLDLNWGFQTYISNWNQQIHRAPIKIASQHLPLQISKQIMANFVWQPRVAIPVRHLLLMLRLQEFLVK